MAESFYGPWQVVLERPSHRVNQCFVISGSDSADGRYSANPGDEWTITVRGAEWTIGLEAFRDGTDGGWQAGDVHRETTFESPGGLQSVLELILPDDIGLRLICTSLDEVLNPEQLSNPYDFTYGG
jgi:hypothetical protein